MYAAPPPPETIFCCFSHIQSIRSIHFDIIFNVCMSSSTMCQSTWIKKGELKNIIATLVCAPAACCICSGTTTICHCHPHLTMCTQALEIVSYMLWLFESMSAHFLFSRDTFSNRKTQLQLILRVQLNSYCRAPLFIDQIKTHTQSRRGPYKFRHSAARLW